MNTHNTTGRTKMIDGVQYSEVIDTSINGRTSAQWTRTSNLTMTPAEAAQIMAEMEAERTAERMKSEESFNLNDCF